MSEDLAGMNDMIPDQPLYSGSILLFQRIDNSLVFFYGHLDPATVIQVGRAHYPNRVPKPFQCFGKDVDPADIYDQFVKFEIGFDGKRQLLFFSSLSHHSLNLFQALDMGTIDLCGRNPAGQPLQDQVSRESAARMA